MSDKTIRPSGYCRCCGDYMLFPELHQCPPAWEVRSESDGAHDWSIFNTSDAEGAAERAAETRDCQGDYA